MSNTVGVFGADSLRDARVALRAALYDAALELTRGCEDWPAAHAEQAVVVKAETIGRRDPVAAVAYLTSVEDVVTSPQGRFAFAVQLGKAHAAARGFAQAESRYAEARALADSVPDGRHTMAYHDLRMRWFRRECDVTGPDVQLALAHPDPSIASAAFAYRAWMHAGNGDYGAHVADLRRAVRYASAPAPEPVDVATLAASVHALAQVGFETADSTALAAARTAFEALVWTPDVAMHHYLAVRAFGWDAFMRGRAGEAQWAFREARGLAPAASWRALAHADRAYVARISGNDFWAGEELAAADAEANDVPWPATHGEERQLLVVLAVLHARADAPRAQRYASLYAQLGRENVDPALPGHFDQRAEAHERYAVGRIEQTLGRHETAVAALREAYAIFDAVSFRYRAALTAAALAELTGEEHWRRASARHSGAYPGAPLVRFTAEARAREEVMPAQLTPVQRQIARALWDGATPRELSRRFSRSTFTIENQIATILRAFGVSSPAALLDEAHRRSLV